MIDYGDDKYLAFSAHDRTTGGGWDDFNGSAETIEEARELVPTRYSFGELGWYHIVDIESMTIVETG